MYCPDSGDPKKDQVIDYWRMQFLKEIERDMNQINLKDDQKEVQMIKLIAIEETPHLEQFEQDEEFIRSLAP